MLPVKFLFLISNTTRALEISYDNRRRTKATVAIGRMGNPNSGKNVISNFAGPVEITRDRPKIYRRKTSGRYPREESSFYRKSDEVLNLS